MTPTRDKLQTLARLLLEEDAPRFEHLMDQLLDDPQGFERDGHAQEYDLPNPYRDEDVPPLPLEEALDLLMHFAEAQSYLQIDPDADGFDLWVAARAHALGLGSMDLDFVDDWVDAHTGEPGFLPAYLKMWGAHLAPLGLELMFLDLGDDTYRAFVIHSADRPRLPQFDDTDEPELGWLRLERWDAPSV